MSDIERESIITVPARLIKAAQICCSKAKYREELRSIIIEVEPGSVRLVSTDSYRMCVIETQCDQNDFERKVLVEASVLARSIKAGDSIVTLNTETEVARIYDKDRAVRDLSIFSVRPESPFDWRKVAPADGSKHESLLCSIYPEKLKDIPKFFDLALGKMSSVKLFRKEGSDQICLTGYRDCDKATYVMMPITTREDRDQR